MIVQVKAKMNARNTDCILFDAEVSILNKDDKKTYIAETDLDVFELTPDKGARLKTGEATYVGYGDLIDEAIEDLVKNLPFYKRGIG